MRVRVKELRGGSLRCTVIGVPSQLAQQPAFRDGPLAFDGGGRHRQRHRGFLDRQSAEEAQLDNAGLRPVERFEPRERAIQIEYVHCVDPMRRGGDGRIQFERHGHSATFLPRLATRVIQEDAPHQLRGDAEEMTSILPIDLPLIEQPQIRLVDDGGDLETVVPPFATEAARRKHTQLVVDERHQPVECVSAAILPLVQELGDFGR